MDYCIYKLKFTTPVHFGKGRLSAAAETIYADTLFSAFCQEALKIYGEDGIHRLYNMTASNKLVLSDTMPYCGDVLFIPKPIITVDSKNDRQGDSKLKKKFKKLKYIPFEDIEKYTSGEYMPVSASFGNDSIRAGVSVKTMGDNDPYNIGIYSFENNCGLYFIAGTEDKNGTDFIDELMESLSYTGLGGKTASGLGKFEYTYIDPDKNMQNRFNGNYKKYMSLSVSMAENDLENILKGASYELIKRSGFVASENYADTFLKKRDFYCFKGGSCFEKRFDGSVFDVSAYGGHAVYRYAKPLFIGIE